MPDKSFLQAMQDLQAKIATNYQESINRMILQRITATNAALAIQDENMRDMITDELIAGQIIALLALLRDLQIIDDNQCSEFTAYLQRRLIFQQGELASWNTAS